jgi:uncharacterized protein (TIGR02231 family)
MKHHTLLIGSLLLLGATTQAADIAANSKVSEVTVYQDRALVTRSATVTLPTGEQQIVFDGLPAGLDENSVRARGTGKGYKILGVEIRRDYKKVAENDQTKKLRDQIKSLQQKTLDLEDEQNDLTQKRELLNRLSNSLGGDDDKKPPTVTDIKSFTDYYGSQNSAISARLRAIERSSHDIAEQINELSKQLATLIQPGSSDKRTVVVSVNSDSQSDANIQVDYLIYGCSWQPQYDAHYQSGSKNLTFTAYGIIRQNTGENWDSVKTTLSTARPLQGTSLPDLTTWTVNLMPESLPAPAPKPMAALQQRMVNKAEVRGNYAEDAKETEESGDEAPQSVQTLTANVETRGFTAVYKVPAKVSVPSDGQPHRCTISIQEMSAEQSYTSIPKYNSGAFVKAKVKNANAAPLLPGQLNIFMENDFIGSTQQTMVGPEGAFDLFLGKDDSIKVQRKDKTRKEESSGVFSKSKVIKMGYTIELENFQNNDVVVTVKDQIPVSQNEKIKVTFKASVQPSEQNNETGELTWKVTIPAKKKITVDVDFQVECPPNLNLMGV